MERMKFIRGQSMNFLIIGTGHISERLADALLRLGITPYAVYSRSEAGAREFCKKTSTARAYTSLTDALADSRCEAVYVASPPLLHKEHTIASLLAGKHVLCEKALATSYAEYLDMRNCADRCERVLLEAMRPAFDPITDEIARAVGKIGKIKSARLVFGQYSSRYDAFKAGTVMNAFNPEMKNSALYDLGVYPIYMAVRLFGEPFDISSRSVYLENGFEGEGAITLFYENFEVSVEYSKIRDMKSGGEIVGEGGTVSFDRINAPESLTVTDTLAGVSRAPVFPCENNMVYEAEAFINMVNGDSSYATHTERSEAVMRLLDRAYPYAK